MTGALLFAYVLALVIVASLRTIPVRSAWVQQLRALFPSWRFFDDIGEVPVLWVRVASDETADLEACAWELALPTPRRRWWNLVWNPEASVRLAYDSLLVQLLHDADEHAETLSEQTSYRLTTHLAAYVLRQRGRAGAAVRYQLKVTSVMAGSPIEEGQDVVVSPVLPLSA